jgi:isoamylase
VPRTGRPAQARIGPIAVADAAPAPTRTLWSSREGSPVPQGVTWIAEEKAYNFALYSKHATAVTLLLYREDDGVRPQSSHRLDHRQHKTGRVWHCRIPDAVVENCRYYAFTVEGDPDGNGSWQRFDPQKVLFDPYARELHFPVTFDREAARHPGSNAGAAPLGVIPKPGEDGTDWDGDIPPRHEGDAVIYELHVDAFTRSPSSGVPPDRRGTYLGLIEKIPYLRDLGVTVVELMPVFQFDPQEGSYWGYMPLSFFAVHAGYATNTAVGAAREELRQLIRAFHRGGLEVVIDVVYNHTAEGDHRGPTYSMKGIDNSTFYLMTHDPDWPYANHSGTGNTLHTANYYVRKMILDSLRYWVEEMHVDGFRFDLASVFTRRADGSVDVKTPGIFAEIASDPVLSRVRLIAEPWDASGAYLLGRSLPGIGWAQWNGRFRDDVRRFARGDPGMTEGVMRRLYGSDDLFPDDLPHCYRPEQSINFVTSHDGFTLYDLVSYNSKRNWANGEENRDGMADDFSFNCGWEGDDGVPADVLLARKRQAKFLLALLLLSNGTPMLRAGDEFLHTQKGNNNPFNQNNETSWLDWSRLESNADVHRFVRSMIAFRKAHPTVSRSRFWRQDVEWRTFNGGAFDPAQPTIAFRLSGGAVGDADLYVMINASPEERDCVVPASTTGRWLRAIDTSRAPPYDVVEPGGAVEVPETTCRVGSRGIVVLVSEEAEIRASPGVPVDRFPTPGEQ